MDKQTVIKDEQKFIENLVIYGKEISMQAANDKNLFILMLLHIK